MKPTLLREIQDTTTLINPILSRLIVNALPCQSNLHAKIRYALTEKGLRVRPFLVRMGYEMGGGHYRDILPIGAALELMQIATLVIDDILDESYLRNGRESIFAKWGIKKGILVGELLKTLSTVSLIHYININKKFRRKNNALMIFENAYKDICVGQYLDLLYEEKNIITEEDYLSMIEKTTASFIRASIVIGATLSCTSKNTIKSLSNYGLHLGIAYQIRDDIIDIIGESACTGKPFAGDIRRRKKRLPIIHAFNTSTPSIKRKLLSIYKKEELDDKDVNDIITILHENGSIAYSIEKAKKICKDADSNIIGLGDEKIRKMLFELTGLVSTFDL